MAEERIGSAEPRKFFTGAQPAATRPTPSPQRIAELAYSYWEARGRPSGSSWEDWFRAERTLRAEMKKPRPAGN